MLNKLNPLRLFAGHSDKHDEPVEQVSTKADPLFPSKEELHAFIREGASQLGGSEKMFLKHLNKFITNYAQSHEEVERLFKGHEYEEAHRLAHSIKGLAGTLSLYELQEAAKTLEGYLKPFVATPPSEADLAQVYEDLAPLLSSYAHQLCRVCSNGPIELD